METAQESRLAILAANDSDLGELVAAITEAIARDERRTKRKGKPSTTKAKS